MEQLRWVSGLHIPRDQWLCHFCKSAIETPEHALLECTGSYELVMCRNVFVEKMLVEMPVFLSDLAPWDPLTCLKVLIANRPTISLLAAYVHNVLLIFESYPVYNASTTSTTTTTTWTHGRICGVGRDVNCKLTNKYLTQSHSFDSWLTTNSSDSDSSYLPVGPPIASSMAYK